MFDILKRIILHPIQSIKHPGSIFHPTTWCNEAYVNHLRSKGAIIGQGTRFISPANCNVDVGRTDYITIGNNCCLSFVTLLAHDYSWYTLLGSCNDLLPDSGGEVQIGNNCFIGYQALILKGSIIGDNVIIGARSVVKGIVPSNTVWAGVPARQICTIEEFYQKKKKKAISDAIYRRDHIRKIKNRNPNKKEMAFFCFLFLDRTEENYIEYIKELEFNGIKDCPSIKYHFFNTEPVMSFEEFLEM